MLSLKESAKQTNPFELLDGMRCVKARDIKNAVPIKKILYARTLDKLTGETSEKFIVVIEGIFPPSTTPEAVYFYAPSSMINIINNAIGETADIQKSLSELNDTFNETITKVSFEKVNLDNGHTYIRTKID